MFAVPALVEEALRAAAGRRLPAEVLGGPALTAAVVDRSRRYTSERERLVSPGGAAGLGDLAARALFFTIADAPKVHLPLAELRRRIVPAPDGFLDAPALRVLDAGAGCGAMTLGLLTFLAGEGLRPRVTATLIDRDQAALAIAADAIGEVAAALGIELAISARGGDVTALAAPAEHDLVLAGSVLNELEAAAQPRLAAALVAALAPAGVAIIVEPALRETTRALHGVRDALIAGGTATVLAPCTRRVAPCPALADERDWCHDHRPVALPPRAHQLAHVTGLRDGEMKLAYLALARPAAAPPPAPAYRIVADPHPQKGKHEVLLCGAPGWVPVRLLRRNRSDANRALERGRRGDLVRVTPGPDGDLGRADPVMIDHVE
ncbi:MAG TPA: small ribosomal subunit Rsm22 family protein [Kofleriaceae bacterium]|nr:small ribosomal subunit Rsm22 family protein [Kofleriaceae bacterium]